MLPDPPQYGILSVPIIFRCATLKPFIPQTNFLNAFRLAGYIRPPILNMKNSSRASLLPQHAICIRI
jgi:hypothetical protein